MSHELHEQTGNRIMKALRFCLFGWLIICSVAAQADSILVVLPGRSALTDEFVDALRAQRSNDDIVVHQLTDPLPPAPASLVVTLGLRGLEWRLEQPWDTPTIATYVSRSSLNTLPADTFDQNIHVLLANPPPLRQLRLAKLLVPRARSVGLLHSSRYAEQIPEWRQAAAQVSFNLNPRILPNQDSLARQLVELLDQNEVLVAADDPEVYNADNLKTILLTSYTRNKVLIGPSAPFVNAGSLSSTFSSPTQTALSLGRLIDGPWQGNTLSYPHYFSVLSNPQVARSLGFPPPNDQALAAELERQEAGQ